jgi:hypothetical protein
MPDDLVVLLAICASATRAHSQSLAGTWKLTYPAGMRMINGAAETVMATGTLTIQATRDSLVGDLVTDPSAAGPTRPPAHLTGKVQAGEAVLVGRTKATINMNGAMEEAVAVSTWVLHVKGDSLTGTVERKVEGHEMANQAPSTVTGVRRQG